MPQRPTVNHAGTPPPSPRAESTPTVLIPPVRWTTSAAPGQPQRSGVVQPRRTEASIPPVRFPQAAGAGPQQVPNAARQGTPGNAIPPVRIARTKQPVQPKLAGAAGGSQRHRTSLEEGNPVTHPGQPHPATPHQASFHPNHRVTGAAPGDTGRMHVLSTHGSATLRSATDISLRCCPHGGAPDRVVQRAQYRTRSQSRNAVPPSGLHIHYAGNNIDLATYVLGVNSEEFDESLIIWLQRFMRRGYHPDTMQPLTLQEQQRVADLCDEFTWRKQNKPSARSTFGYNNPSHTSRVGLELLEAGAHTPYDPNRWSTQEEWLTSPHRNFITYSPNSRTQDPVYTQGHSNVVFGHDEGASQHFNRIGHMQSPHTNYGWNHQKSTFHGLENRDKSNRSGASAPRYQQPSSARGSLPMYWDPTDPRYDAKYEKPFQ